MHSTPRGGVVAVFSKNKNTNSIQSKYLLDETPNRFTPEGFTKNEIIVNISMEGKSKDDKQDLKISNFPSETASRGFSNGSVQTGKFQA